MLQTLAAVLRAQRDETLDLANTLLVRENTNKQRSMIDHLPSWGRVNGRRWCSTVVIGGSVQRRLTPNLPALP